MLRTGARRAAIPGPLGFSRTHRGLCSAIPSDLKVEIGDVSVPWKNGSPRHIPVGFGSGIEALSSERMAVLRWLMQKDSLGQDAYLLGEPTAERRELVMQYAELVGRELEVREALYCP